MSSGSLPTSRSDAVRLDITLGSASQARRPRLLKAAKHLGDVVPDSTGAASAVEAHGTLHWLRHKDGPSRVVEATPGVRARLPRPFDGGRIAYVADHDGVEALYIKEIAAQRLPPAAGPAAGSRARRSCRATAAASEQAATGTAAGPQPSGSGPAPPRLLRRAWPRLRADGGIRCR